MFALQDAASHHGRLPTLPRHEVAMPRMLLGALIALAFVGSLPQVARAQVAFSNSQMEWGLRPDVPRVPHDGAPFSEVYNSTTGVAILFGASGSYLWDLYYVDRVDRALRFGYPLPAGIEGPPPPPAPRVRRFGLGLGLFHGR
jgi:hypothetical protein